MAHTLDWFEIRTHNIEKISNFYEALFGWKLLQKTSAEGTAVWIFDTGDEPRLENLRRGGFWLRPESEEAGLVVYIRVEDIESTLDQVTLHGGQIVTHKIPVGSGHAGFFKDPEGTLMGLYQD